MCTGYILQDVASGDRGRPKDRQSNPIHILNLPMIRRQIFRRLHPKSYQLSNGLLAPYGGDCTFQ